MVRLRSLHKGQLNERILEPLRYFVYFNPETVEPKLLMCWTEGRVVRLGSVVSPKAVFQTDRSLKSLQPPNSQAQAQTPRDKTETGPREPNTP